MSGFSNHWKFVEEISAPFKEKPKVTPSPKKSNIFEDETFDLPNDMLDIQAELEAKFDELFGSDNDDDDDDDDFYEYDDFDWEDDDD